MSSASFMNSPAIIILISSARHWITQIAEVDNPIHYGIALLNGVPTTRGDSSAYPYETIR